MDEESSSKRPRAAIAPEIKDEIAKLQLVDLQGFLTDRKADAPCEACGSNAWGAPGAGNTIDTVEWKVPDQPGRALPTIPLICENCGNVRSVAAAPIARWKLRQAK